MSLQEAPTLAVGVAMEGPGQQQQQQQQQQSTHAKRASHSAAMKQSSSVTMAVVSGRWHCQAMALQHASNMYMYTAALDVPPQVVSAVVL
jgi:hypothetical protein